MSGRQYRSTKEALARLPGLELRELQELWCRLYKNGDGAAARSRPAGAGGRLPNAGTGIWRAASGVAAPAPSDRLRAAANRTGHNTRSPSAKARDAVAAGMAGPEP